MYTLFSQNVTIDFNELPQYDTFLTWCLTSGGVILLIALTYWARSAGSIHEYQRASNIGPDTKNPTKIITSITILAYVAFALSAFSFRSDVTQQRGETVQAIIQSELGTTLNPEQLEYVLSAQTKSRFRVSIPIGIELPSGEQKSYSFLYTGEGNKYELAELSEK